MNGDGRAKGGMSRWQEVMSWWQDGHEDGKDPVQNTCFLQWLKHRIWTDKLSGSEITKMKYFSTFTNDMYTPAVVLGSLGDEEEEDDVDIEAIVAI